MLHFDEAFEENLIAKTLSDSMDYNVDGLFNFRLRMLKESWEEIADVAARLLEGSDGDKDVFDIATFISGSEGGKSRIATDGQTIDNITQRRRVEIVRLYDDSEYNLIDAIVKEKPFEIYVTNKNLSDAMRGILKKIAKVIEKI